MTLQKVPYPGKKHVICMPDSLLILVFYVRAFIL